MKMQMDSMKKAMPTVSKTIGNMSAKASGMAKKTTTPNSVLANRAKLDVMAQKASAPKSAMAKAPVPTQKSMPVGVGKGIGSPVAKKPMPTQSKGKAIGRARKASYGTARPMPKF